MRESGAAVSGNRDGGFFAFRMPAAGFEWIGRTIGPPSEGAEIPAPRRPRGIATLAGMGTGEEGGI
jgi:hypothetical protein